MKKTISFVFLSILYFLFSHPILAKLPNQGKREIIESLAKPLEERRVFYRWQSEKSRDTLIKEKKFTKERLKYFMRKDSNIQAGPGLYVAEDLHSSSNFGETIIQIEANKGVKYIDLTDQEILKKLRDKGVNVQDIYNLNPRIAIKYNSQHWVFKTRKKVTFRPFSAKGIPLEKLQGPAFQKRSYFREIIRKDILKRAEKNLSNIIGSPFIGFLEEEYGRGYIQNTVNRHKNSLNSVDEINGWLRYADRYLNKGDMKNLIKRAASLPIASMKQSEALLKNMARSGLINKTTVTEILKKTPPAHNISEAIDFIEEAPFLSVRDKEKIFSEISIKSVDDFIRSRKNLSYIPSKSIKRIARQIIPLIENSDQSKEVLYQLGEYLNPSERKQIVNKTIPLIASVGKGSDFLSAMKKHHPELSDIKKVARRMISLIHNAEDGREVLYKAGKYLNPSDIKQALKNTIPLIRSAEEGSKILKQSGEYLDSSGKKQIMNKTISLIADVKQGAYVLGYLRDFLEISDIKKVARRMISLIHNAEDGREVLYKAGEYLNPSDKKRIMNKVIPLIMNAEEGTGFLDEVGKHLDPSDKKRIVNRIIPLINNAEDGKAILSKVGGYLEPSERKRVVKAIIPLINNAKAGEDILFLVGGYLEPSDRKRIAKKIIQFTGRSGFEEIKKLLSEEEYKELMAEFENKKQKKSRTSSGKDSDKKIRRLNCLKEQLRQVSLK